MKLPTLVVIGISFGIGLCMNELYHSIQITSVLLYQTSNQEDSSQPSTTLRRASISDGYYGNNHIMKEPLFNGIAIGEYDFQDQQSTSSSSSSGEIVIGKKYSNKPCKLEPAWGLMSQTHRNDHDNDHCVGETPDFPNTTATYLDCSSSANHNDKPTLIHNNGHQYHPGMTIALLYFAKPSMLLRQLEFFSSYPEHIRRQLTLLIIDDGSPNGLRVTDYVNISQYDDLFRLRLARIATQLNWNIGGARNLAFYLADTERVLLLDVDVVVPVDAMTSALSWTTHNSTHKIAHRFSRKRPNKERKIHPAICVIDVASYWENGGCDEDFVGNYGYTDVHFWYRWKGFNNQSNTNRLLIDHDNTTLYEFEQKACDKSYLASNADYMKCQEAKFKLQKVERAVKKNRAKYWRKLENGCWSNRYLRFKWILEK